MVMNSFDEVAKHEKKMIESAIKEEELHLQQ